jgi:hypothetical protein
MYSAAGSDSCITALATQISTEEIAAPYAQAMLLQNYQRALFPLPQDLGNGELLIILSGKCDVSSKQWPLVRAMKKPQPYYVVAKHEGLLISPGAHVPREYMLLLQFI